MALVLYLPEQPVVLPLSVHPGGELEFVPRPELVELD